MGEVKGVTKKMLAIILAAGLGKRLMPLTVNVPKALIEIRGITILEYAIRCCINNDIDKFVIVAGHKKERVIDKCYTLSKKYNIDISIVENERYTETNTGYSLYLALQNVAEDVIIINGDNVFDERIITKLLRCHHTSMIIDAKKELDEESFKIILNKNIIEQMGKNVNIEDSIGEFIGISKVIKNDIEVFKHPLIELIEDNSQNYYDITFKELNKTRIIDFVYSDNLKWTEIDTFKDLEYANEIIRLLNN